MTMLREAWKRLYGSILLICLATIVIILLPVRLLYIQRGGRGKFPYYYLDQWVGFP